MGLSLHNYIIDCAVRRGRRLWTDNTRLRNRIRTSSPEVDRILDCVPSLDHDHIATYIEEWLKSSDQNAAKLPLRKYTNVIDEAEAIVAQSTHGRIVVATNNSLLRDTISAMAGIMPDSEGLLRKSLWVKSAEAIFLLNRIRHIDHCCNHPWVMDSIKSNLFYKNHTVRNQTIATFALGVSSINPYIKHNIKDLVDLHYKFLISITGREIENSLDQLGEQEVTVYEYIGLLNNFFETDFCYVTSDNRLELISIDEIPWIEGGAQIWVAGVSADHELDVRYVSSRKGLEIISYSTFENGVDCYVHPAFLGCEITDLSVEHKSYSYKYLPPAPRLSHRKNSFAINHVTKLLNNPHNFYTESILKLKSYNFHPNHIVGILVHSVFEELIKRIASFEDFSQIKREMEMLLGRNHFTRMEYVTVARKVEVMLQNLWDVVKDSSQVYAEHEGMQRITHNGKEYYLHGRADLIYEKDGKYGVIDFKTGNPPSWVNIINGSAPQISIAMLMLKFGGFLDKENIQLADSGFISPKGMFKIDRDAFILESAIDGIKNLIHTFWEQETPYYLHINDLASSYRVLARGCYEAS